MPSFAPVVQHLEPTESEEPQLAKASKTSNLVLKRDAEPAKVKSPAPKLVMTPKPVLPVTARYRWQKGFRKINGNYVKVPFAKLELDYGAEAEFLPSSLKISLLSNNNEDDLVSLKAKNSRNVYNCEVILQDVVDKISGSNLSVFVQEATESNGRQTRCLITEFKLLIENVTEATESDWIHLYPILSLKEGGF